MSDTLSPLIGSAPKGESAQRVCGECSLCCTVLRVDALRKLGGVDCLHQDIDGPGCSIHAKRPRICRAYRCAWLKGSFGEADRPDRLGAVSDFVSSGATVQLEIHESEPGLFDRQPRLQEIAEVALAHIKRVDKSVVSFGQGCEGDPLLAAHVIEQAIRLIRSQTSQGTINMNTNGSLPARLQSLFDAGLDSIRISINSVREECYDAYFRPKGYGFADVLASIKTALARKKHVAINYLNSPGFSDTRGEADALAGFLQQFPIHMIQWRNLNFDPLRYWKRMDTAASSGEPMGMEKLLQQIRGQFPDLRFGYFNPPKEKF